KALLTGCLLLGEAYVVKGKIAIGDGGKYYWHQLSPIKVLKNTINANLRNTFKIALENYKKQPEEGQIYIFHLDYYNPEHPEYGLKIISYEK
ncbi:MAG: hypothetical protein Q7T83_10610, partial [Thermodesulfovibrionales bacterium]|nr:hypothetical protein [Thermodesulfovibrionales bacterium]